MNPGYILGIVRQANRPVQGALVGLDWVRAGDQLLPIYRSDADSMADRFRSLSRGLSTEMPPPLQNLWTQTNSDGAFVLAFQWSGTDIGIAVDNVRCQIFVLVEERRPVGVAMALKGRYQTRMITTVSLGQVSSGLISNPTQIGDQIGIGVDIMTILRGIRLPMIGRTIAPPSPDMYALLAGYRINLPT